jgi:hypothetical protein
VIDECPIQSLPDGIIEGRSEIDAADLSAGMRREACDCAVSNDLLHVVLASASCGVP